MSTHDLRVAEVATAVLVYLHTEAARRQAIVEVAIADYGEIASCCGHFFGVEFLGQPVALGAVAEVDAHYQRVVLLGYWILAASCLGVDRGGVFEASGFSATICDLLLRTLRCSGPAAKATPARVTAATTPKARKTGLARADDFFVVFPV